MTEPTTQETMDTPPQGFPQNPPKARRRRRTKEEMQAQGLSTPSSSASSSGKLEKQLDQLAASLNSLFGMIVVSLQFANEVDAKIVANNSEEVVNSIINLARVDERARKVLLSFGTSSAYMAVFGSVVTMLLPILANHGFAPRLFAMPYELSVQMDKEEYAAGNFTNGNN